MGISIADFNDDGFQDVFIANDTEPNALFINKGNGDVRGSGSQLGVGYDETAKRSHPWGATPKISIMMAGWIFFITT